MSRQTRLNPTVTQLESVSRVVNWSVADAYIDFSTKANGDPPAVLDTAQSVTFTQSGTGYQSRIVGGKLVPQASLPGSGTYATYYQAQLDADCRACGARWTWDAADGSTDALVCVGAWAGVYQASVNRVPASPAHIIIQRNGTWQWYVGDGVAVGNSLKTVKSGTFTPPASDGSTVWEAACYIDSDNGIGYLYLPGVDAVTGTRWVTLTNTEITAFFTNAVFLGRTVSDGAMTSGSTTLTSATANFVSANDVGKAVTVADAGAGGTALSAYIYSVTNSTTAVLTTAAGATVSGKAVTLSALAVPTLASTLSGSNVAFVEHYSSATPQTDRYPKFLSMWGEPRRAQRDIRRLLREKAVGTAPVVVAKFDDTRTVTDGAMSSSTNPTYLNSATAAFVSGDVGRTVVIAGAGAAGANLSTVITAVNSGTQAVVSAGASTTVSGATVTIQQTAAPKSQTVSGSAATVYVDPAGTLLPVTITAIAGPLGKIAFSIESVYVDFKGSGPKVVTDAAMTAASTTLSSASAPFTNTTTDRGKRVTVVGAGAGGADLVTFISSAGTTTATLEDAAATTVSGATARIEQAPTPVFFLLSSGSDNTSPAIIRGNAGDVRASALSMLATGLTPGVSYTWTLKVYKVTPSGSDCTASVRSNGSSTYGRPPWVIEAVPI